MDGERLAEVRNRAGLTQAALAEMLGQSQSHYARYERGVHDPSSETLKKICLTLDVSPEYLLDMVDSSAIDPFGGAPLSEDEATLISWYRKSTPEGRTVIRATAKAVAATASPLTNNEGSAEGIA